MNISLRIKKLEDLLTARDMVVRSERFSPRSATSPVFDCEHRRLLSLSDVSAERDRGLFFAEQEQSGVSEHTRGLIANGFRTVVTEGLSELATTAVTWVMGGEDGEPYGSAFVSFPNLTVTNAALQMVQYSKPFEMDVTHAPDPEDGKSDCIDTLRFGIYSDFWTNSVCPLLFTSFLVQCWSHAS